jgi:hypothetical protein
VPPKQQIEIDDGNDQKDWRTSRWIELFGVGAGIGAEKWQGVVEWGGGAAVSIGVVRLGDRRSVGAGVGVEVG